MKTLSWFRFRSSVSHVNFTAHHRRYLQTHKHETQSKDRRHSRQKIMISLPLNQKFKWFFWHSQSSVITRWCKRAIVLVFYLRVAQFSHLRCCWFLFDFFLDLELKDEDEQRVVKMETNNHLGRAMCGAETRMFTTLWDVTWATMLRVH